MATLLYANLTGANLRGADLRGTYLYETTLYLAEYTTATRWPEGFNPRDYGAVLVY
jgi:uncharacterized protein YjbI with pentapeptide repeats